MGPWRLSNRSTAAGVIQRLRQCDSGLVLVPGSRTAMAAAPPPAKWQSGLVGRPGMWTLAANCIPSNTPGRRSPGIIDCLTLQQLHSLPASRVQPGSGRHHCRQGPWHLPASPLLLFKGHFLVFSRPGKPPSSFARAFLSRSHPVVGVPRGLPHSIPSRAVPQWLVVN